MTVADLLREQAALRYWRRRVPGLWGRADRRRLGWINEQLRLAEAPTGWEEAQRHAASSIGFIVWATKSLAHAPLAATNEERCARIVNATEFFVEALMTLALACGAAARGDAK
jgi:hypothetical protein